MASSYLGGPRAGRPFIVTPYVVGPEGVLVPEMPTACPSGAGDQQPDCKLHVHHHRDRKTGPRHRLTVVACRTHGRCFTLYPPGFWPYGRHPVVRLSPDGKELEDGDPSAGAFTATLFEAAFDARQGRAWARDSHQRVPERWWSTQGRYLRLAARLLGVAEGLAEHVRESVAAVLSVGTLVLREHSGARGYRQIGEAVCEILSHLQPGQKRPRQLLVCGHLIGRWGEPLHWDARRGALRRSAFRASGRRDVT